MNSNAELLKVDHQISSLADLSLPCRTSTLIALAKRFGAVHPCYGIDRETKACTCGGVNRKTKKPCNAGKHPIIGAWQVNASTDPSTIGQLANRYPEANWGVVTGEVIDVIDLDEKPGISGLESLRVLEGKLGLDVMLPRSRRHAPSPSLRCARTRDAGIRAMIHSPFRTAGLGNQMAWMISRRRKRQNRCGSGRWRDAIRRV
jgi:Bifunctional DNA primase/polymerase, N-terminal